MIVGAAGKAASQPVNSVHYDCSLPNARRMIYNYRADVIEATREVIRAEDHAAAAAAAPTSENQKHQCVSLRYAAYSVWGPLAKVRRDRLAMVD